MAKKSLPSPREDFMVSTGKIELLPMEKALQTRYLAYAMSTITARSLPDVRDGLKPVHRRILWAMRELKLPPTQLPKKSARVVGDAMGKYHPHGDASIYDAMVRMAQDFSMRYPLIDGQGNFGNIDGDSAAAMRYTEARLTPLAEVLMEGLNENAVDFRSTYDGEGREPEVMPAGFPSLLANGTTGIAVGMATSIPPHNLGEICEAMMILLKSSSKKNPQDVSEAILRCIKGPDFPTGGVLVEPEENIQQAYRTGRGSFRLRAHWEREDQERGNWVVVITEIPYMVQKASLIEDIATLLEDKKLPEIEDVRDESDERVRIIVVPKSKSVDPNFMMERLFKMSKLEIRFPLNMNVLDHTRSPSVMSLQSVLQSYLEHRRVVMVRRAQNRLDIIAARLEILEGLQIIYLNLDQVIKIIRDDPDPKATLMRQFSLTDRQADWIMDTTLRSLRRIEEAALAKEMVALRSEQENLMALIASQSLQNAKLYAQLKDLVARFKDDPNWPRRTRLSVAPQVVIHAPSPLVGDPITLVCSRSGWIRAVKGHVSKFEGMNFKEGDGPGMLIPIDSNDRVIVFMSDGRAYTLSASQVPIARTSFGDPLRVLFNIPGGTEIVAIVPFRSDQSFLALSTDGYGFRVQGDSLLAHKKVGREIMVCNNGVQVRALLPLPSNADMVALTTERGKLLCFPLEEIPENSKARGVLLCKGGFTDICLFNAAQGFSYKDDSGKEHFVKEWEKWKAHRAQVGQSVPKHFSRSMTFNLVNK